MPDIMQMLAKNSRSPLASILQESRFYQETEIEDMQMPFRIKMLNVAMSGKTDGGLTPGILMICGESKTFKTGFMLEGALAFQRKHPDGVILFYDSEKGAPIKYFKIRGIDMSRILHTPIFNIEELKFDLMRQLKMVQENKVPCMVMVDSIGMLASTKEVQNAEDENSAADMTRARELNSLMRIITPYIAFNDIPVILINHGYTSMDGKGTYTVSGGKKIYLACDDNWIVTRQQDGSTADLKGYWFTVTIDKSRLCREKTRISINCTFEDGINENSGLFEEACECGMAKSGAWCKLMDFETGELSTSIRRAQIPQSWFDDLCKQPAFIEHLHNKFCLEGKSSEEHVPLVSSDPDANPFDDMEKELSDLENEIFGDD